METTPGPRATVKKRSNPIWKILRIIIIIFVLLVAGIVYWKYYFTYSSGNRFGLLQRFSHKGNVFKTYEGEMILSSVEGNQNVPIASEKFYFSVTSNRIANQLMNLQGKHVTVHYLQKNGTLSWRGDSEYIVDSVVNVQ